MRKPSLFFVLSILSLLFACPVKAQQAAIKTNMLYDAAATVNLGVEFRLGSHWTIDLSGNYNNWTFKENKKWKHWLVQPEGRYWLCESFNGHFFALHALGGQMNVGNVKVNLKLFDTDFRKLKSHRYAGWFAGVGIGYGYAFMLGRHWNLELEAAIGYIHLRYDKFEPQSCGPQVGDGVHDYFGPTKLSVGLVYVF